MIGRSIGLALALCGIVAVGCGGGDGVGGGSSTIIYSCNIAADSVCFEWTARAPLPSMQVTALQNSCTAGGTFANGSGCPTASRLGTCAQCNHLGNHLFGEDFYGQFAGLSYEYRFYSPGYTATNAQTTCNSLRGIYTAG